MGSTRVACMALDPGGAFVYLKGSVGYCVDPSGVLAKELTAPPGFDIGPEVLLFLFPPSLSSSLPYSFFSFLVAFLCEFIIFLSGVLLLPSLSLL